MIADKNTQRIVLDLEMNPISREKASEHTLAREVIEIGAIRVCRNATLDRFQTYVKPSFCREMSPYIRRLTGIHDGDLKNAPSFKEAVRDLSEWIGTNETVICTWSDADRRQLMEESTAKSVELPDNMVAFVDVQRLHYEKLGDDVARKQMALQKASEQLGIIFSRKASHSALYDASITAEILNLLETGKYQKQLYLLRKATSSSKESAGAGYTLGDLCKGVFEQWKSLQPV